MAGGLAGAGARTQLRVAGEGLCSKKEEKNNGADGDRAEMAC